MNLLLDGEFFDEDFWDGVALFCIARRWRLDVDHDKIGDVFSVRLNDLSFDVRPFPILDNRKFRNRLLLDARLCTSPIDNNKWFGIVTAALEEEFRGRRPDPPDEWFTHCRSTADKYWPLEDNSA